MSMKPEEFYRNLDEKWCQGDIIREVPHVYLKPPLIAVRKETTRLGERFAPFEYQFGADEEERLSNAPRGGFKFSTGEQVLASSLLALGMVLTHGCEIDKDLKHRLVALIRPLGPLPTDAQQIIRDNKNLSYCYLPAFSNLMGESYLDFRRMTTLHPDFLRDTERVLSLTDEAVNYVNMALIRFVTRRDVSPEALSKLPII